MVSLNPKRKQNLEPKLLKKNISHFIELFLKSNTTFDSLKTYETVYRFLYEQFTTNIEGFKNLISNKENITGNINIEYGSFNSDEQNIINTFLAWDNIEKNKAIFDISSYAIEYCLLTNNSTSNIHLIDLKNKIFYLDTNIIYRALGINGENRKNRTKTFLKKFSQSGEELKITKITESEFKDSIKFYIDKLKKFPSRSVNPQIFEDLKSLSSIYDFYYKWRFDKVNASFELFEAHILSLYEMFKQEFSIKEDYKSPFDSNDDRVKKEISELANSIYSFKTSEKANNYYESSYNDAENILWIDNKRGDLNKNIFESKFFFISTDQTLRRWDYNRNHSTPIVVLPSQWLTILLRYVNRTDDDFKSFVSFLNLKNNESNFDLDRLNIVISGISEITDNPIQQRFIVKSLIDKKFNELLSDELNEEEVYEGAKRFAQSTLQRDLEKLNDDLLEKNLAIEKTQSENEKSKNEIRELNSKISEILEKNAIRDLEIKKSKRQDYLKNELKKWRKPIWIWFIFNLLCYLVLGIFLLNSANWILENLSTVFDNSKENLIFILVNWGLGLSTTSSIAVLILKYFNDSNINAKKSSIIYPKELEL